MEKIAVLNNVIRISNVGYIVLFVSDSVDYIKVEEINDIAKKILNLTDDKITYDKLEMQLKKHSLLHERILKAVHTAPMVPCVFSMEIEKEAYSISIGYVENKQVVCTFSKLHSGNINLFDMSTGLPNKQYLQEAMKTINKLDEEPINAVGISINLAGFESFNMLYGLSKGEAFLKEVALKLQQVSPEHTVIAKVSNDCFYLFITNYRKKQEIEQLIQEIINSVIELQVNDVMDKKYIHVDVNVGVAYYPDQVDDCEKLLCMCDVALMQAQKQTDKKYAVYEEKYKQDYFDQFHLVNDIRRGAMNDEFQMYYQPIIATKSMEVTKMEALIRWNHPEHGVLSPARFISAAETSGEIIYISHQMLKNIAKQIQQWNYAKIYQNVMVTINIAPIQLEIESFYEDALKVLNDYNIQPSRICFEITETMSMAKSDTARNNIKQLRNAGCLIAIDDFGLEYSTLSYLEEMDFDIIKIDRIFTQSVKKSYVSQSVVNMIRQIMDKLNKKCIVEGIETKEQMELLQHMGFEEMQGYYFSKPVSLAVS